MDSLKKNVSHTTSSFSVCIHYKVGREGYTVAHISVNLYKKFTTIYLLVQISSFKRDLISYIPALNIQYTHTVISYHSSSQYPIKCDYAKINYIII